MPNQPKSNFELRKAYLTEPDRIHSSCFGYGDFRSQVKVAVNGKYKPMWFWGSSAYDPSKAPFTLRPELTK